MADGEAQDPRQLMAQLELVQRELARTQSRLEAVEAALVEANQAISTLRELADPMLEREVLVPLGAGVHVHATIKGGSHPIIPIGAGYATEASPQAAMATLERRIQDITQTFNDTAERAEQLAEAGAQINQALSQMQGDGGDDAAMV